MGNSSSRKRSNARAWIVGSLLIPINCYWIVQMEEVRRAPGATNFSLFFNAVFILLVLFLVNLGLRKYLPKLCFDNRELLIIYIMINMASAICSYGMVPILVPSMTYAFWGATPENEWAEMFHRYIPKWLVVDDLSVLKGYYRGDSTFYTSKNLSAWLPPLAWWSFFVIVLVFVMLCINTIVRRQWIQKEKLAYPIAEIPLDLVNTRFYNKLVWIGIGIGAAINIINGLHFLFPSVPGLMFVRMRNIGYIFTGKPWTALRAMRVSAMPSMIGLSFFMPLDLLFSCWFFYFYWQGMRILGSIVGWRTYPGYGSYPYIVQESIGAYLAILILAIWRGKRHFSGTLKRVFVKGNDADSEVNVPMSYRSAWAGVFFGLGIITLFCYRMGISVKVAIFFFVFYYSISTAVTRLRAEIGFPAHDVHFGGPIQMITSAVGSSNLSRNTLGGIPLFWFISRRLDSHIMPHQLESFKIADRSAMSNKSTLWSMVLASVIGIVSTFWVLLHLTYKVGIDNMTHPSMVWATEPWKYLEQWLNNLAGVDYRYIGLVGLGFGVATFLSIMRTQFLWWPFHPIGYAVAGSYGMSFLWTCMFISWFFKFLILKYGGIKRYRQAAPLFLGLVLGEFAVVSIWTIIGIALGLPSIYQFVL